MGFSEITQYNYGPIEQKSPTLAPHPSPSAPHATESSSSPSHPHPRRSHPHPRRPPPHPAVGTSDGPCRTHFRGGDSCDDIGLCQQDHRGRRRCNQRRHDWMDGRRLFQEGALPFMHQDGQGAGLHGSREEPHLPVPLVPRACQVL